MSEAPTRPALRFNPALEEIGEYPFVELDRARQQAQARLGELIDFGAGDPYEATPELVRRALVASIPERLGYPRAAGLPELRAAIARWVARRYGTALDPEREVVPTSGSKEAIFSLAQIVVDPRSERRVVAVTQPGYPVPARAARLHGAEVLELPLHEDHGFLPDLEAVPEETWRRVALLWLNYPNNPTGAVAPLRWLQRAAELARAHGFVLACDEAYSEIYFSEPPPGALQLADRANLVVFNSLSKRSSMTGYRSGFVAGDPAIIERIRRYRPVAGTAPPEFVQRAAIAAWDDEVHVEQVRSLYAAKRAVMEPFLRDRGLRVSASQATFYLWVAVPGNETSAGFARRLLDAGVVVAPGSFFGEAGEGYVRMALVPTLEQCHRAVELLGRVL